MHSQNLRMEQTNLKNIHRLYIMCIQVIATIWEFSQGFMQKALGICVIENKLNIIPNHCLHLDTTVL